MKGTVKPQLNSMSTEDRRQFSSELREAEQRVVKGLACTRCKGLGFLYSQTIACSCGTMKHRKNRDDLRAELGLR